MDFLDYSSKFVECDSQSTAQNSKDQLFSLNCFLNQQSPTQNYCFENQDQNQYTLLLFDLDNQQIINIDQAPAISELPEFSPPWKKLQQKQQLFYDYCELGQEDKVQSLIGSLIIIEEVNLNQQLFNDKTPLIIATIHRYPKIVERILKYGGIGIDKMKRTAVHWAALQGFTEILEILIEHGCQIDLQDSFQNTPLHYASENGHFEAVELLLRQKNIKYKTKNLKGQTPIQICQNIKIRSLFHQDLQENTENYEKKEFGNCLLNNSRQDHVEKFLQILNNQKKRMFKQKCEQMRKSYKIKINPEAFDQRDVKYLRILGKGSFGEVYLVEYKSQKIALKILKKKKVFENDLLKYAKTERNVLSLVEHPFLVKMLFAYQNSCNLYLAMEYCCNGDLGKLLIQKKKLQETEAKFYVCEIILAIGYLHAQNIIYRQSQRQSLLKSQTYPEYVRINKRQFHQFNRDLKPDNIVLDQDGHIKLTDYGLCKQIKDNQLQNTFCGSVAYLAPEILNRSGHNKSIDWYLLGVLLYEMLVGAPPYYDNNRDRLFQNILSAKLIFPKQISPTAKDFISKLLCRNINQRLGANLDMLEIQNHIWFQSVDWNDVYQKKLKPPFLAKQLQYSILDQLKISLYDQQQEDQKKVKGWTFIEQ